MGRLEDELNRYCHRTRPRRVSTAPEALKLTADVRWLARVARWSADRTPAPWALYLHAVAGHADLVAYRLWRQGCPKRAEAYESETAARQQQPTVESLDEHLMNHAAIPSAVSERRIVVYTDASVMGDSVGVGLVFLGFDRPVEKSLTLAKRDFAFGEAEIEAIICALDLLRAWTSGDGFYAKGVQVVVLTDFYPLSVSCRLQAKWQRESADLNPEGLHCRRAHLRLWDRMLFFEKVEIKYVRGHNGEPLNECADRLARRAAKHQLSQA